MMFIGLIYDRDTCKGRSQNLIMMKSAGSVTVSFGNGDGTFGE